MATKKYLDEDGAVLLNQLLAAKFNTKADKTEIPTKTSDLTNDSNFAVDANYIHTDNNYTTAEKNKLSGIATGAQVNVIDTIKVNNVTQAVTNKTVDISVPTNTNELINGAGFITKDVNDLTYYTPTSELTELLGDKLDASLKGAPDGLAELDSNGKVPASQLPSFVDDIIEGYYHNGKFYEDSAYTKEISGETGKIYVDLPANLTYRWSGTAYVLISSSLALGETSSTAYRGDRGKIAYDHATDANRLTTAQTSGFYKFATSAEGHIKSVTAVAKADLTGLGVEDASNKVTSLSGSSTNTQYPGAKLVYDQLALKQDVIDSNHKISADNVDDTNTTHKFVTSEQITKLEGIETGAEANVIEVVKVDGTALTVTDKAVNIAGKENTSNKVSSLSASSTNTQYPGAKLVYDQLALKEAVANKVTSLSASSTNTQYPSAKLVYDQLALKINSADLIPLTNQEVNTIFDFEIAVNG